MTSFAIYSVPYAWGLTMLPVVVRILLLITKGGKVNNANPRDRDLQIASLSPTLQGMTARLLAAHQNQYETLGYYAAGVAIAVAVRVPSQTLDSLTSAYLKCRLAFILAYASPQVAQGGLRTVTFFASMAAIGWLYKAAAEAAIFAY